MSTLERRRPSAELSARCVHEARGEAHAGVALLDGCGPRALADGRGGDVECGGDLAPRQPLPQEFGDSPPRRCAAMPEQVQLQQLAERTARAVRLEVHSPVARVLTALEQLRGWSW